MANNTCNCRQIDIASFGYQPIDTMRLLDLALLRNFAVVARTGSISLASSQVGRTQSALSMQMHRLEDLIG
jgi:Bacterial regulatory helix-turn-helix protein, lysR family